MKNNNEDNLHNKIHYKACLLPVTIIIKSMFQIKILRKKIWLEIKFKNKVLKNQ